MASRPLIDAHAAILFCWQNAALFWLLYTYTTPTRLKCRRLSPTVALRRRRKCKLAISGLLGLASHWRRRLKTLGQKINFCL